jgi:hypothetical protein
LATARALWLGLLLIGCRPCVGDAGDGAEPERAEGTEQPEAAEVAPAEPPPAPEGVHLSGEPARYGEVEIAMQVHGPDRVRVRRELTVERRTGSGAEPVDARGLTLRPSCEAEAPECIELVPGAELRPPPWTGALGEAQCPPRPAPRRAVPAGAYRFVAITCEGERRIEGAWFELGG